MNGVTRRFIYLPVGRCRTQDLLDIIEDRHASAVTVITSQYPTKEWHHLIGEPIITDAIRDRLLHHSYKIELKGDSIQLQNHKVLG